MNILVVDDEKEIADLMELYLTNEGFTVYTCYTGLDALKALEAKKIDLALLDVMLPDMDGFSICRRIREGYRFPVIMLTAKVEELDKITGLSIGADDYITKPFSRWRWWRGSRPSCAGPPGTTRGRRKPRSSISTGWSSTGRPTPAPCTISPWY